MPDPNRDITCSYKLGAMVIDGVGTSELDAIGVRTLFMEVTRNAYREHKKWRITIEGSVDLMARVKRAWPKAVFTPELREKMADIELLAKERDQANRFPEASPEKQRQWIDKHGFKLKFEPMGLHQVTSIGYALLLRRCALFPDTGLGKTFIGIGIAQVLRDKALAQGKGFRVLVVAPKTLLRAGWGADVDKFSDLGWEDIGSPKAADRIGTCPVCGHVFAEGKHVSLAHLKKCLKPAAQRVTEKHPTPKARMDAMITELYRQHPRLKAAGKDTRKEALDWALEHSKASIFLINPENAHGDTMAAIKKYKWDMIIVDESSMMRNSESRITNELRELGEDINRRIIMTATPRPNTSLEFWGQMSFVDNCLGANFNSFKNKYFEEDRQGYRCWPKHGAEMEISDIIAKRSLRFRQRDCIDLPDETIETIEVGMSPEQKKAYAEMVEDMSTIVTEKKADGTEEAVEVSVNMKIAQMMKLAQIGSGFIYSRDREEPVLIEENPRIDETVRLCEQFALSEERQVVVWVRFSHTEGEMIKKRLRAKGITTSNVWGEMTAKELESNIADFKGGKTMVMLANATSAKFGHTWTSANAMIFHSYDYSWEAYYQCKKRIMRFGQTRNCTYINIVTRGSIDKQIMKALVSKENASALVVDRDFMTNVKNLFEEA